jgi:hypothetical protein
MPEKLRPRLTYANLIATIALFVALGATSYAVATGSIGTREIKNNSIRTKDVRNNDIRSKDVRNGTLLAEDFKAGQLPAGPKGETGAEGAQGGPGVSGLQLVFATSAVDSKSPKSANAICPAGKRVIGSGGNHAGGVSGSDPNGLTDVVIDQIQPSDENTVPGNVLVSAFEEEPTGASWAVTAFALCANVS